jgi:hypothetical protein
MRGENRGNASRDLSTRQRKCKSRLRHNPPTDLSEPPPPNIGIQLNLCYSSVVDPATKRIKRALPVSSKAIYREWLEATASFRKLMRGKAKTSRAASKIVDEMRR